MVRGIEHAVAFRHRPAEEVAAEPFRANQQPALPVQRLTVHGADVAVDHAGDAAPGKLQHPAVLKGHDAGRPVLLPCAGGAEDFRQEAQRNAGVFSPDLGAAVQAVVLQFLPQDRRGFHPVHPVPGPRVPVPRDHRERRAVACPGAGGLRIRDGAVRFPADAGEQIIPDQRSVVQGLSVIPVFDVQVHQIRLLSLVEGKVVLPDDADLRNRAALVDPHPVQPVLPVHVLLLTYVVRDVVVLRPALPDGGVAALVDDLSVSVIQQVRECSAAGSGRACQHIGVIAGEHGGHQVAHGHALHEDPALVDVVFPLHLFDQRKDHVGVVVLRDIVPCDLTVEIAAGRVRRFHRVPFPPPDAPYPVVVGVREEHDEAVPLGHHRPGGVDALAPSGHQSAVQGDDQRSFPARIVAGGYIDEPCILLPVFRHDPVELQQPFRPGL